MVSASTVVANGWMEGSVAVSAAREIETLCNRRNSNWQGTGEHSHEQSGRKERKYLINKQII